MKSSPSKTINNSNQGRIILPTELSGPENMATDVMLLEDLISSKKFSIAFRFYTWDCSCISIGKNQKNIPRDWLNLLNEKRISIVRRPSGGDAVLHSNGLTYALLWKNPPKKKHEAYIKASQWLINGFLKLGIELHFGSQSFKEASINCFASSTPADLVDNQGQKRIGSAQFWNKGHLLQHGEILIKPSEALWERLFKKKPPYHSNLNLSSNELATVLIKSIRVTWPEIPWVLNKLSNSELASIKIKSKDYLI